MSNYAGEIIAKYRRERGLTQEQLSDGICDAASLSRFENGRRTPSKGTYKKLMERLGVYGFSYFKFSQGADYECEKLKAEILDDLSVQDISRLDEKIYSYNKIRNHDSLEEDQFFEAVLLIWEKMYRKSSAEYYERFLRLLEYTHPDISRLFDTQIVWLTYEEKLILNNMGLALLDRNDAIEAANIYRRLILYMEKEESENFYGRNEKAAIYNNLALCMMELNNPLKAQVCINRAMDLVSSDGGGSTWLRFLRTKAWISGEVGDIERQEKILQFIKSAMSFAKILERPTEELQLILNSPLGISIL